MTASALAIAPPKKSHHKKKAATDAVPLYKKKRCNAAAVKVPGPAGPAASSNLFELLGGNTVAVGGDTSVVEAQRHAVLQLSEAGEPSIRVSRAVVSVGLSESLQQHVPTYLLANAVISLMSPPSMTREQWFALAWAHPTLHATLERLGGVTSLVSLSVFNVQGCLAIYYRGVAECAVPVTARRVSPVPEPDVMLGELAACVCVIAEHAHAARQNADIETLIASLA